MKRCQQDISELEQSIQDITQRISHCQQALTDLDKASTKAKEYERNINDNIRLRAQRKEIESLEQAILDLDVDYASRASSNYDAEYHKARKLQADLQAEVRPSRYNSFLLRHS